MCTVLSHPGSPAVDVFASAPDLGKASSAMLAPRPDSFDEIADVQSSCIECPASSRLKLRPCGKKWQSERQSDASSMK